MSLITGDLRDTGYQSMFPAGASLVWTLNETVTTSEGMLVSPRKREIVPVANGLFSFTTVSTDLMHQDAYYTLGIQSLDPNFFGPGQGFAPMDFTEWKIKVPEGTWKMSDLIVAANDRQNPLMWFYQSSQPSPFPVGSVWVHSVSGDINQRVS